MVISSEKNSEILITIFNVIYNGKLDIELQHVVVTRKDYTVFYCCYQEIHHAQKHHLILQLIVSTTFGEITIISINLME